MRHSVLQKIFFFSLLIGCFQTKAQQAIEVFKNKTDKQNQTVRESFYLKENQVAKVYYSNANNFGVIKGTVQQIADTFLVIEKERIPLSQITTIAFEKSKAAYQKQKLKGLAITLPAVVFASLFIYGETSNKTNAATSCIGGIGSLIFIPATLIWGIPMLFNSKTSFQIDNENWNLRSVKIVK